MRTPASKPSHHQCARAFALIEAAAIIAVFATLSAIFIVIGNRGRQLAMASDDLANLRHIGQLTGQYAADNQNLIWGFTWLAGQNLSQWPELNNAPDNGQAARDQAVDYLRRATSNPTLPKITAWFAHLLYSPLVLQEYAGRRPPARMWISAGDRNRLLWASDVEGFNANKFGPNQPNPTGSGWRWPYSSSYNVAPFIYSVESGPNALHHQTSYQLWISSNLSYTSPKSLTDIAFPSHKVHLHDSHARHFGQHQPYFAFATREARVPLLLFDASASLRSSAGANLGWNPLQPTNPSGVSTFAYDPTSTWEPPAISPSGSDSCFGVYQFTRSANNGRDFGGPEIPYP